MSTATVPAQINMLHVALIPQLLQAHHTVLHNVNTSLPIALLVLCQTLLKGLAQDYSTTQLIQDYSTA